MYHKGIVMEIKDKYCLIMNEDGDIIRIHKKGNMHVGDQIYYLLEDVYKEQEENSHSFLYSKSFHKTVLLGIAVVLIFVVTQFTSVLKPVDAYATVSFDKDKSFQVELDENTKIKKAISYNHSVSDEELKKLEGKKIIEVKNDINKILENKKDSLVIGFAFHKDSKAKDNDQLRKLIDEIIDDDHILYVRGNHLDIVDAKTAKENLGLYIVRQIKDKDIDDVFDDLSYQEILDLIKKNPALIEDEEIQEKLENRQEDKEQDFDDEKEDEEKQEDENEQDEDEQEDEIGEENDD